MAVQGFVLPGFGPAAEVLLFRQKDPKPMTPSSAGLDGTDAGGRADQLATLRQGPQDFRSVRPKGRTAGVDDLLGVECGCFIKQQVGDKSILRIKITINISQDILYSCHL